MVVSQSCHEESFLKQVASRIFSSFPLLTSINFNYHRFRDDSLCKFHIGKYFFLVEYIKENIYDSEHDLSVRCFDGRITYEPLLLKRMKISVAEL